MNNQTEHDHTNEVERRVTAIPIMATDICGFFQPRETALVPLRECWYCAYGFFGQDTSNQSGFCKFKK